MADSKKYYRDNYTWWRTAWFLEEMGTIVEPFAVYWPLVWRAAVGLAFVAIVGRAAGWF
jgi:hypothetical protein